jgi:excisionase family DNA binding protein
MTTEQADLILQELGEIRRLLERQDSTRLLTVEEAANRLSVSVDYCYRHANRLGAIRLGEGQRQPLRFPANVVELAMAKDPDSRSTSSTRVETVGGVELLPVGGSK